MSLERSVKELDGEIQYTVGGTTLLLDKSDYENIVSERGTIGVSTRKSSGATRPVIRIRGRTLELGRYLLQAGKEEQVDHINRNPLDNRRSNLRKCSHAENTRNRKIHKNNTVGFKGVAKVNGSYQARLRVNGELIILGNYHIKELAAKVHDLAAIEHHGEFAVTNFPKEEILAWKPEWEAIKCYFD